jgi:tetratricopeptide (TPR) repeat protein
MLRAAVVALLLLPLAACLGLTDAAEREYLAALRGENEGLSRERQIALLDHAIALRPERARYREIRAIYLIDLGRFDAANADLDAAIARAGRPYLRYLRGLVLCQRGQFAASLPDFDAAIAGQPRNAQFYRGRSLARAKLGQVQLALADAETLLRLTSQDAIANYVHGMALAGLGRDAEAEAAFSEAIRKRPELAYPLLARAETRLRMGDAAGAAADRATAGRVGQDRCGVCVDPFRY